MSEERLREAFRQAAGEVKIAPDPFARLMRRHRGRRRMRAAGWTTALAASMAALLLGPVGLTGTAGLDVYPRPTGSMSWSDGIAPLSAWTKRLIAGPTRGALAADQAFIQDLTLRLTELNHGDTRGYLVKILFAQDIDDYRLVVAARYSETHQTGVYLAGLRGGSAAELAELSREPWDGAYGQSMPSRALTPYLEWGFGFYTPSGTAFAGVSLAPRGCEIATARRSEQGRHPWLPAPTTDYLIWPASDASTRNVRVTCNGLTRFDGALAEGRIVPVDGAARAAIAAEAIKEARGRPSPDDDILTTITEHLVSNYLTGPIRILYGGPVPGTQSTVYVGIAPTGDGLWSMAISAKAKHTYSISTSTDVGARDAVFIVDTPKELSKSLVIAPRGATELSIFDAAGNLVTEVELTDGIGVIRMGWDHPLKLEAHDARGQVVGTGEYPLRPATPDYRRAPVFENWT